MDNFALRTLFVEDAREFHGYPPTTVNKATSELKVSRLRRFGFDAEIVQLEIECAALYRRRTLLPLAISTFGKAPLQRLAVPVSLNNRDHFIMCHKC